ncbi:MAG: FAD-binding protein, partial [Flavobacteriaceae bacterium]|nr:FAD-binding protein [Flavobacteriaceae bacterium]
MSDNYTEVLVIGSGFGASVAALRFAEAGKTVTILEKGDWINRENFEADANMFWLPNKGYYGMNHFEKKGRHIVPWLGVGVGGGSHVYAGTLKRREFFDDFPGNITVEEMSPYYDRAETMMQAEKYPDYPPYNSLPSYCVFRQAEKKLQAKYPEIVEAQGDILLAISYAPQGVEPGSKFVNKYGASQQYSDPDEQTILGGEIDVKNTLDKNYLFLAQKHGAKIKTFSQVFKIELTDNKKYKVYFKNLKEQSKSEHSILCDILICGAGSIGSTELLLKNKLVLKTLPKLSSTLGKGYHTNGDYITFLVPKKGLLLSWGGLIIAILGWIMLNWLVAIIGIVIYVLGWILSKRKSEPDKGTTNSDYIRFKHKDDSTQGSYIEGGRYPTPFKAVVAVLMSLGGNFRPMDYGFISKAINWMGTYLPVFEVIERSWPIPMLMMGRDDATGNFFLNKE